VWSQNWMGNGRGPSKKSGERANRMQLNQPGGTKQMEVQTDMHVHSNHHSPLCRHLQSAFTCIFITSTCASFNLQIHLYIPFIMAFYIFIPLLNPNFFLNSHSHLDFISAFMVDFFLGYHSSCCLHIHSICGLCFFYLVFFVPGSGNGNRNWNRKWN